MAAMETRTAMHTECEKWIQCIEWLKKRFEIQWLYGAPGQQLTYEALEKEGMPKHEIPELIASYCKNAIPTFKAVVTFETAKNVLSLTSDTATKSLSAPRPPRVH